MEKRRFRFFLTVFLLCMASAFFCPAARAQANDTKTEKTQQSAADTDKAAEEQQEIINARENAKEARTEAEKAKQELELQKKEVELQKQQAEIERKEAEIAQKEVEAIKEITKNRKEIQEVLEKARAEKAEAEAALARVKITEEKILTAEEEALLAEQLAEIAAEKAKIAELKIREKRKITYIKAVQTVLILFFGYLLLFILVGIINRRVPNLKRKHLLRKNTAYALNFVILVSIIVVWVHNIQSITIFFSVIGAGVVLALQETILCMAGWLYIIARKPYEVGDRIEFGGVKGDVIDIMMFNTTMLEIGNWADADQSTGRLVEVPNSNIFKQPHFNFSRGFEFIWNEIKVMVTFESDWKRGEEIMMKHGNKEAEGMEDIVKKKITKMTLQYMIFFDKLTPVVYTNIKDSGVERRAHLAVPDRGHKPPLVPGQALQGHTGGFRKGEESEFRLSDIQDSKGMTGV